MEIPQNQWGIVWKAINHWMKENNLSPDVFYLQIAGTQPPYLRDRLLRGLKDGSEPITSDLVHHCVRIFRLASARQGGSVGDFTDEECIELLIAPLTKNDEQGKFQF